MYFFIFVVTSYHFYGATGVPQRLRTMCSLYHAHNSNLGRLIQSPKR